MYMTGSGRDCKRQLYQILYDELGEKQGAVKALKSQCTSWLAARMRFKDIDQSEWLLQFMKNWNSAADAAVAKWQERAQKLSASFELRMCEELHPQLSKFARVLRSELKAMWPQLLFSPGVGEDGGPARRFVR